jgi:hypothetical protein
LFKHGHLSSAPSLSLSRHVACGLTRIGDDPRSPRDNVR